MIGDLGIILYKTSPKRCQKACSIQSKEESQEILNIIKENPYQNPPPYEKLIGDLTGAYSKRINIKHRIVYQVYEDERSVKLIRLWPHYD